MVQPTADPDPDLAPELVLGPMLRYVDSDSATIWVQTSSACEVTVRCGEHTAQARTWAVKGRHYALAVLTELEPDTTTAYTVLLDAHPVWPQHYNSDLPDEALTRRDADGRVPDSEVRPPSVIRTLPTVPSPDRTLRVSFGSCYRSGALGPETAKSLGADALVALARYMATVAPTAWPDAICLLGDQIYADNAPEELDGKLTRKADGRLHATTFAQYTALYAHAWSQPDIRWLFSTVPTCMILDDHDLRDDWNTSQEWREEVTKLDGWRALVEGALSSYWVYQHLGNLSPTQLAEDTMYRTILDTPDEDERGQLLADFAWHADAEPEEMRWSYFRDFGKVRLLMLDTRCSRDLRPGRRRIVDREEWEWTRQRVLESDADHVLIGCSVPVLMLPGIHQLEGWNEAITSGNWGRWWSSKGEAIRRLLDLEHWAAFRLSFNDMVTLVREVASKPNPPKTLSWLSGDVHSSYIAEAELDDFPDCPVALHQLTMSPFRNPLPKPVRAVKKVLGNRRAAGGLHIFARRAKVDDVGMDWTIPHGPWFRNGVMTLEFTRGATFVHIDHALIDENGAHRLSRTRSVTLAQSARAEKTSAAPSPTASGAPAQSRG